MQKIIGKNFYFCYNILNVSLETETGCKDTEHI